MFTEQKQFRGRIDSLEEVRILYISLHCLCRVLVAFEVFLLNPYLPEILPFNELQQLDNKLTLLEETRAERDAVQKKLNKLEQKFKQRENDSSILIKVIASKFLIILIFYINHQKLKRQCFQFNTVNLALHV